MNFASRGGTVVISSHVMSLVEGLCTSVAIINEGQVLTSGTVDEVRGDKSLTDVFIELVGGADLDGNAFQWLGGN